MLWSSTPNAPYFKRCLFSLGKQSEMKWCTKFFTRSSSTGFSVPQMVGEREDVLLVLGGNDKESGELCHCSQANDLLLN